MSNLLDLFEVVLLPLVLLAAQHLVELAAQHLVESAAQHLVESLFYAVATGVSLWSRGPARRAEARRLMRSLRRRGSDQPVTTFLNAFGCTRPLVCAGRSVVHGRARRDPLRVRPASHRRPLARVDRSSGGSWARGHGDRPATDTLTASAR
jgi:hypothetical protein